MNNTIPSPTRPSRHRPNRRMPVILQMTSVDCGAACLAMILTWFGRATRLSECHERCAPGRDGITALTLFRAASAFGLSVKAFSLAAEELTQLRLPAIVAWQSRHFVVVERCSPDRVVIIDPAVGRRRISAKEFEAAFTGLALVFEPGPDFEPRTPARSQWRTYLTQILRIPGVVRPLALIFLLSVCLQALGLTMPLVTKLIVDRLVPGKPDSFLPVFVIGIVALLLVQMGITCSRSLMLVAVRVRMDERIMPNFLQHLLDLPFIYFQQRTSGDLLMRMGSNNMIRETLTAQVMAAILDSALVLVYLSILIYLDPVFAAFALGIAIVQSSILLGTAGRMRGIMDRELLASAGWQSYLAEVLRGVAVIKASGSEERAVNHWSGLLRKQLAVSSERGTLTAVTDAATSALRSFTPLILLCVGAHRVLNGTATIGMVFGLTALAMSFLAPLESIIFSGQQLQMLNAQLDRIADVLETSREQESERALQTFSLSGRIEFRNVGYRYSPNSPFVLRGISLTIEPGQKIALVGPTGSGKTTLALLLLGFYEPSEGEIIYDGVPLKQLDYRKLRSQFGVVLQESFLFSGSIRENIAFTDPAMSLDRIAAAARVAAIHDEIEQMPMGYETILAEGGVGLSGGQRQRLSIARAVAHNPSILLLDEATSHLDVMRERSVAQNLSSLSCVRIVVAHRLSTVRDADVIVVLEKGEVLQVGTHDDLLKSGGLYSELVRAQENDAGGTLHPLSSQPAAPSTHPGQTRSPDQCEVLAESVKSYADAYTG